MDRSLFQSQDAAVEIERIRQMARPLSDSRDLTPLMDRIGDARFVLLGEASHGTSEYYTWRAEISKRLILEKGFSFIAIEGDWPDCYRVNRYVKGAPDAGESAYEVLHAFDRWPTWMWANREIEELVEWLLDYNGGRPDAEKVGFYGLDVYSLWDSMRGVLEYLREQSPHDVNAALKAFRCFEPYSEDVQQYAMATRWVNASCEPEVIALLAELRGKAPRYDGDGEAHFNAEQNALVAKNAERYYRTMVRGGPDSWNIRDRHMVETLERLMAHHGPSAKAIVWEHNTHIGDARATDMARGGMVNVGQLVREGHRSEEVALVGFGSFVGSVIAGEAWEAPMERMPVPPANPGSWEELMHRASEEDKLLILSEENGANDLLRARGHRAIGVIYDPRYESFGNYVPTVLPQRYDAFLYLDQTQALHPLHLEIEDEHEVPETYPTGV
jgi:erythromycin esterase-like protein